MQTTRYYLSSFVIDGKGYVAGGNNGSGSLNTVEKYDPVSNKLDIRSFYANLRDNVCS